MFSLSEEDLAKSILGCGDGPASFNVVATQRSCRVVSVDPIYQFSGEEIESRINAVSAAISDETRRNSTEFVWTYFRNVDELIDARMSAMSRFLTDFAMETSRPRYVAAALPELPFADKTFDLALCSHFLFLYSEHCDASFHIQSIAELARTALEVRVFPLLELGSRPSRHLETVIAAIRSQGLTVERVRVSYEFQKGGNEMLRIGG
jgi:hypothetical protein